MIITNTPHVCIPDEVNVGQTSMCPLLTADCEVSTSVHVELLTGFVVHVELLTGFVVADVVVDCVDENQSTFPPNISVAHIQARCTHRKNCSSIQLNSASSSVEFFAV